MQKNMFNMLQDLHDDEGETETPAGQKTAKNYADEETLYEARKKGTSGKNRSEHKKKGAAKEKISGTGRGKEDKKGGAGQNNWGTYKDDLKDDKAGEDGEKREGSEGEEDEGPQLTVEEYLQQTRTYKSEEVKVNATQKKKLEDQFKGLQKGGRGDIDDAEDRNIGSKLKATDAYAMVSEGSNLLGFRPTRDNDFRGERRGGRGRGGRGRGERRERGDRREDKHEDKEETTTAEKTEGEKTEGDDKFEKKEGGRGGRGDRRGGRGDRGDRRGGDRGHRGGDRGDRRGGKGDDNKKPHKGGKGGNIKINFDDNKDFPSL